MSQCGTCGCRRPRGLGYCVDGRAVEALIEAAREMQCTCSVKERESGHLVGCWMPDLIAAIERAESA